MAFSRALFSAVLLYIVTFAHGEVSINDLSGVWRSYHHPPDVNILTSQGPSLVCRDTIPPECDEEITPIEVTITFNGTTFKLEATDREDVTTIEESAATHPECAKDGIYPFERIVELPPPGQITSYNATNGRMYYIDPRRPDDLNCVIVIYRTGENGPYIEVDVVVLYKGSIPNILALGASYRCDALTETCKIEVNDQGELDLALQDSANYTCIDGECLNAARAASPSASHAPNESLDDL